MTVASHRACLSGWGRYPVLECEVASVRRPAEASDAVRDAPSVIARGLGRAYGDAALNPSLTVEMAAMDRVLEFDPETGFVTCESGLSLQSLIDLLLPRGWFPKVTPGTKFVTVGGMIASDVHGKNHHRDGSQADWLDWFELCLPDGRIVRCSPDENSDLFAATCGGMGLTGLIVRARFQLGQVESARIRQKTIRARNLDAALEILEATQGWTYSVAWIDALSRGSSLGRSVVFVGEHARRDELGLQAAGSPFARALRSRPAVPIDFPNFALSRPSVTAFNEAVFRSARTGERIVDLDPYFYPLDSVPRWNRIYGRRGFLQYQCVLPLAASRTGMIELLEAISAAGLGSFLSVLKRMGAQSFGMLSFPMPGYTLALDFPASPETTLLLTRLDEIVERLGGRVYLTKDARMSARSFAAGYPRLEEFRTVRRQWKLDGKFRSALSDRLEI